MRIAITGATGFLGRPLCARLIEDGHDLIVLTRRAGSELTLPRTRCVTWSPSDAMTTARALEGVDAVVNLAGEPMDRRRWSDDQKRQLRTSRVQATRALANAIRGAARRPPVLVSASAVGYYGPHGDEVLDESARAGTDFVARLCAEWEAEAQAAASRSTRVVVMRSGLVLAADGGALKRMLLPFRLGLGGRLGTGTQYWSWIHRSDWVDMVRWAIATPAVSGPVNVTAPEPVTNATFTRALGAALHRPALLPVPAFALRLMLGEMADAMLLTGQRVVPDVATRLGFTFRYGDLRGALDATLSSGR